MAPYDDWNKIDDEDDEELQDNAFFEGKKDVILFAIDCSESMHELRDDPNYEDTKTSHLFMALDAAMQIQKKKVIVGPNDSVGILLFNTTRENEAKGQAAEIKKNNYVFQLIDTVNAPKIQQLIQLLDAAREDPTLLRENFPPIDGMHVPIGDVFTSCNWVMRDGAPKTASKRIFLITDDDDPNAGPGRDRLATSAKTTFIDLTQVGIVVEPFFISTEDKPFDPMKFYSNILVTTNVSGDDDAPSTLPESMSISRIEDLLSQMRFHEVPKRSQFSLPLELADGFVIGVKGYGLVTEQRRGSYLYFMDLGDRMEVANSRTAYLDEARQTDVVKSKVVFGMALGETVGAEEPEANHSTGPGIARAVSADSRVFFTAEEVKSFRTLGLEPGLKLLGFKSRKELAFEDNIKHSLFIYPDEMTYSGSKRTFNALLKTMIKKKKIALVLALTRRNSSPTFCALLPQAEKVEEGGWNEPAGFHLIPLPFADDIRAAPIESAYRASEDLKDAARKWIDKLTVKNGTYPPDSYPNPALAYHNAQLEASAFREEFDPDAFEDLTLPKYAMMHKRAGVLFKEWRQALAQDPSASIVDVASDGRKRKADVTVDEAEIRSLYEEGQLAKLRTEQLKDFCRSHGMKVSGKKDELVNRVGEYLDTH